MLSSHCAAVPGSYQRQPELIVLPSTNPIGEIGSRYTINVHDENRLSLPILIFLDKRWCSLVYDVYWLAGWLLICCFDDQITLSMGNVAEGSWWSRWKRWWVRTSRANHRSMWQRFAVLRVKRQKASLNRQPSASTYGRGGSFLSKHQSHDIEADGQCNTHDGSSGKSGTLLQISYFTDKFAVHNILQYYFGTGEDNK
jgi:hypothetical protein